MFSPAQHCSLSIEIEIIFWNIVQCRTGVSATVSPLCPHSGSFTSLVLTLGELCFSSLQPSSSMQKPGFKSQPCSSSATVYFDLWPLLPGSFLQAPNQVWGTQQQDNTNDLLEALFLLYLVPTGFFFLEFTGRVLVNQRGMHNAPGDEDNNGAGFTPSGERHFSGDKLQRLCVCALFIDHIGYIFLKTKNMIFLHHQNLQKLKKKKSVFFFAVHSKAEVFPLSSPLGA